LHLTRVPMDTSKLSIGMYVGLLDRPWLETPFIFQGFEIKDRFEIEQLQKHCHQVYVEIERGKLSERTIRALAAGGPAPLVLGENEALPDGKPSFVHQFIVRTGLLNFLSKRKKKHTGAYDITSTVRKEAPYASEAYEKCLKSWRRIYERAGRAGFVEIERVIRAVTPLIRSILRNPNAMAWTVFSRKRSGHDYSRAVATAVWAIMFGRHLGFDRKGLENLAVGGLLLDIGNTALPDDVVHAEGAITQDQYEQVPAHVEEGVHILERSPGIEPAVFEMVMYHHERFDGSGYPYALEGSNIPPMGRIAGIVDCYDAMTTRTAYSPALAAYDAARELNEMRDKLFSAEVVEQFMHTIGMFPTGSVVELSDGAVGLVLEQNADNLLQPKVLVLQTPKRKRLRKPKIMNPQDWQGRGLWIARGHEHGAFGIDPMAWFN
jgi:HD-GYP domain-containing protein (c-di-GMP phosphodiesterase class II)